MKRPVGLSMFIDTNVFLYAAGAEHAMRAGSQAIVSQLGSGRLSAVTSAEVLQEILHVLGRRGRPEEAAKLVRNVTSLLPVLAVDAPTVLDAGALLAANSALDARDAVHVATMQRANISEIVSADAAFDAVPGIVRRSPAEFA